MYSRARSKRPNDDRQNVCAPRLTFYLCTQLLGRDQDFEVYEEQEDARDTMVVEELEEEVRL